MNTELQEYIGKKVTTDLIGNRFVPYGLLFNFPDTSVIPPPKNQTLYMNI